MKLKTSDILCALTEQWFDVVKWYGGMVSGFTFAPTTFYFVGP